MDLIDNGGYRFWGDNFSIQSAYEDCKAVFDGITDEDSFQECDTGIILYHAHEIMYALKTVASSSQRTGRWEMKPDPYGFFDEIPVCSECGRTTKMRETYKYCPNCGARMGVNTEE